MADAGAMVDPPLVLTIDVGTSSVRALLYDCLGRPVEGMVAQERNAIRTAADGTAEADPEAMLERVASCVDAVLSRAGVLAQQIGAVAVDTLVSNILAVGKNGHPLTPLVIYADTRNDADAQTLRGELDEEEIHERTGCLLRTSYWPARLAWFRRTSPQLWQQAARWITLGEYLELRLFGLCRVSYSAASWSGLLDRHSLRWDVPLLGRLGLTPEQLSPLADVNEPLQGLRAPWAARWPTLRSIPWFAAVGDGAAANVGSGCTGPERIALTVGTTGAMRVVLPAVERVPAGLWCYRVDGRNALLGGATSEGGNVYAWVRDVAQVGTAAETERGLAACAPDGHGLTVLPFWAGERSPGWAGDVRATLHGLSLATRPVEILRASLEAVAYRFAVIEQRIARSANSTHQLIASGSALLSSPTWMQIFADVTGRPVVASAEQEATSRGAALLALHGMGLLPALDAAPAADGQTYEPDAGRHAIYQVAVERQARLYARLIG